MKRLRLIAGLIVSIALALLVAAAQESPTPAVASLQTADPIQIQIEGELKSKSPTVWVLGEFTVLVDGNTQIVEERGAAEPGAWLMVWGFLEQSGELRATSIVVDRAANFPNPRIQITDVLNKITADWWVVGETLVHVTPATIIVGNPTVGSLVSVTAEQQDLVLEAKRIELAVTDPSQMPLDFEGTIEAIESSRWRIDGRWVIVNSGTQIVGAPGVGKHVEARVLIQGDGSLLATLLRVVDKVEVTVGAYVAAITPVGFDEEMWDVTVFPDSPYTEPYQAVMHVDLNTLVDESRTRAEPGQWADVRAESLGPGEFQAESIRLDDTSTVTLAATSTQAASSGASGWAQIDGRVVWFTTPMAADVAGAASASGSYGVEGILLGNGVVWAQRIVASDAAGSAAGVAASPSSAWSYPTPIAEGLAHAALPSLAYGSSGVAHAIWETSGGLYHASQAPGQAWSGPARVAAGMAPSMVVDASGTLHALFANQFAGNYEIYHVRRQGSTWSLPTNVSRTSGYSGRPTLALAKDGTLNAAWMDNTPGYWTIYHGDWNGSFWSSQPVPNGRGQAPSMSASQSGSIFLAWQDRVPTVEKPDGFYDVFVSELAQNGWSLPVNASDSRGVDSLGVSIAATRDGVVHATWVDQSLQIQYCYGRSDYWSPTQLVWNTSSAAYTPRMVADASGWLRIAWDQLDTIWTTRAPAMPPDWPKPDMIGAPIGNLKDVTLAYVPASGATIGWVQTASPGNVAIYETQQQALPLTNRVWLPQLSR